MSVTDSATSLLLLALGCACAALVAAAPKSPEKKLRHVIITGDGEMPYEPLEGFFQGDVQPVNFQDEVRQETMDVALRTGILVVDPNEKKESAEEEEDVSVTNGGQVSGRHGKNIDDDAFHAFRVKHRYAAPRSRRQPQAAQVLPSARSFGYEFRRNVPATTDQNGYNINREYFGDLGEGWNLRDAEEILKGRNYNTVGDQNPVHRPSYPEPTPMPPAREVPPPPPALFPSGRHPSGRHPIFYPFPNFDYQPFPRPTFSQQRSPEELVGGGQDDPYGGSATSSQRQEGRSISRQGPVDLPPGDSGVYSRGDFYPDYLRLRGA